MTMHIKLDGMHPSVFLMEDEVPSSGGTEEGQPWPNTGTDTLRASMSANEAASVKDLIQSIQRWATIQFGSNSSFGTSTAKVTSSSASSNEQSQQQPWTPQQRDLIRALPLLWKERLMHNVLLVLSLSLSLSLSQQDRQDQVQQHDLRQRQMLGQMMVQTCAYACGPAATISAVLGLLRTGLANPGLVDPICNIEQCQQQQPTDRQLLTVAMPTNSNTSGPSSGFILFQQCIQLLKDYVVGNDNNNDNNKSKNTRHVKDDDDDAFCSNYPLMGWIRSLLLLDATQYPSLRDDGHNDNKDAFMTTQLERFHGTSRVQKAQQQQQRNPALFESMVGAVLLLPLWNRNIIAKHGWGELANAVALPAWCTSAQSFASCMIQQAVEMTIVATIRQRRRKQQRQHEQPLHGSFHCPDNDDDDDDADQLSLWAHSFDQVLVRHVIRHRGASIMARGIHAAFFQTSTLGHCMTNGATSGSMATVTRIINEKLPTCDNLLFDVWKDCMQQIHANLSTRESALLCHAIVQHADAHLFDRRGSDPSQQQSLTNSLTTFWLDVACGSILRSSSGDDVRSAWIQHSILTPTADCCCFCQDDPLEVMGEHTTTLQQRHRDTTRQHRCHTWMILLVELLNRTTRKRSVNHHIGPNRSVRNDVADIDDSDSDDDDHSQQDGDNDITDTYLPHEGTMLIPSLDQVASIWSTRIFVTHADRQLQHHVTLFLRLGLPRMSSSLSSSSSSSLLSAMNDPAAAAAATPWITVLLEGVTHRLHSNRDSVRRDGMMVAELVAQHIGQELQFDELNDYRKANEGITEMVLNTNVDGANHSSCQDEQSNQAAPSNTTRGRTMQDDDSDRDEDKNIDTEPYNLYDDQEDWREAPRPMYLSDCLDYLRTPESDEHARARHAGALDELPQLVRSRPVDLPDVAIGLAIQILRMENKFYLDQFDDCVAQSLCALVVEEPISVGSALIDEIFHEGSLLNRFQALQALTDAAHELSGCLAIEAWRHDRSIQQQIQQEEAGPPKVSGKRRLVPSSSSNSSSSSVVTSLPSHPPPPSIATTETRNETSVLISNSKSLSSSPTSLEGSRTRRWGHGRKDRRGSTFAITNRFVSLTPVWFYRLVGRFVTCKDDVTLWGGPTGSMLLSRILITLAYWIEASSGGGSSSNGAAAAMLQQHSGGGQTLLLGQDLYELAWNFRQADAPEVRSAVLMAIGTAMSKMSHETALRIILEQPVTMSSSPTLRNHSMLHVVTNIGNVGGGGNGWFQTLQYIAVHDPDDDCRQLAKTVLQRAMQIMESCSKGGGLLALLE